MPRSTGAALDNPLNVITTADDPEVGLEAKDDIRIALVRLPQTGAVMSAVVAVDGSAVFRLFTTGGGHNPARSGVRQDIGAFP